MLSNNNKPVRHFPVSPIKIQSRIVTTSSRNSDPKFKELNLALQKAGHSPLPENLCNNMSRMSLLTEALTALTLILLSISESESTSSKDANDSYLTIRELLTKLMSKYAEVESLKEVNKDNSEFVRNLFADISKLRLSIESRLKDCKSKAALIIPLYSHSPVFQYDLELDALLFILEYYYSADVLASKSSVGLSDVQRIANQVYRKARDLKNSDNYSLYYNNTLVYSDFNSRYLDLVNNPYTVKSYSILK